MNIVNDTGRLSFNGKMIKEKDMTVGHVYLELQKGKRIPSGMLLLFLGRSSTGALIFYTMGSIWLELVCEHDQVIIGYTVADYNNQTAALNGMLGNVMKAPGNPNYIRSEMKLPILAAEYDLINFEDVYFDWYYESFGDNTPDIANPHRPKNPVKASELIPGTLYYTKPHFFLYVFLGQTSDNGYCWCRAIYGAETIQIMSAEDMILHSVRTKGVKRCWPLSYLPEDPFVTASHELLELARSGWRLDMTGITQYMIDNQTIFDPRLAEPRRPSVYLLSNMEP